MYLLARVADRPAATQASIYMLLPAYLEYKIVVAPRKQVSYFTVNP